MSPSDLPARKSMSRTGIVLIVVGVVVAVCCVGGGFGGYALFHAIKGATGPASAAGDSFVKDLESGNYGDAYQRLCDNTKKSFSEERFGQVAAGRTKPTGHQVT